MSQRDKERDGDKTERDRTQIKKETDRQRRDTKAESPVMRGGIQANKQALNEQLTHKTVPGLGPAHQFRAEHK